MNPEVFYLHIQGEQRGPYTIPQIDHLLNSGLISEDATYWREGLEQWQPVLNLVHRRKPESHWVRNVIIAASAAVVLLLVRLFGPVTLDGWREAAQFDYNEKAAYWRARDVVRRQALPSGALVSFGHAKHARVTLQAEPKGATVWLPAEVTLSEGTKEQAWQVQLAYDDRLRQWNGVAVTEAPR